jgi:hypothetical protein
MSDIFVQIASYRDPELVATVEDALQKADSPSRLSFGIVWQGKMGIDPLPVDRLHCCRILLVDSDRSQGVCWARAKGQALWDGEAYTLQIDSHMRFVQGWDSLLSRMLQQCPSPKPLLTAYPPPYTPPNLLHAGEPTRLAVSHFNDQGSLSLISSHSLAFHATPQLGMFMAAGFWFADSRLLQDVPYDPHLYFHGEETNLSVRAWTHGWDIYHPNQIVCYHEYTRSGKPRHWEDHPNWWQRDQLAHRRLRQLLGIELDDGNLGQYGLGGDRSLQAYEAFCGVNFQQRILTDTARTGIPNEPWDGGDAGL